MNFSKPILVFIVFVSIIYACKPVEKAEMPSEFVNLFIGTLQRGNTVPAATAPFGMISCGPDNVFDEVLDEHASRAGYNYAKDSIRAFSMTHVSGWGCHGALDIPVMPVTKAIGESPVYNHRAYVSKFSHDNEKAAPGFYQVLLDDYNINVQITASERSAILHFEYPESGEPSLVFAPTNCANGITGAEINIDAGNKRVTGHATSGGFCWRDPSQFDYTVYFVADFSHEISGFGVWNNQHLMSNEIHAEGDSIAAWVSFQNAGGELVEMRIAISFVSVENAIENLEHELNGKSFAQVREETVQKWNNLLGKLELHTDNRDMKVVAYTGLYHNLLHPNIFNDVNGQYRGFDDVVYQMPAGRNKYVNFSTWDTYRTTAYLQGLLVPDRASDMIESLYLDATQGNPAGLTIWGYFNNETWVMNGHQSVPLIANMYAMGARDIDLTKIKDIMIWTADNKYRNGNEYIQYGYVPDRHAPHNYSVSQTLEYSIADYGLAQMCLADGDKENYSRFLARSESVFNLFNTDIGYLQRKSADGEWAFPFDKAVENGFNEGNSAQYTWNIPHSLDKLVDKMGGKQRTIARLDEFTSEIIVDGWPVDVPHYWPGNQPGFVVPFIYTYAGAPGKTQELVRYVSSNIFKNAPDGLPGDDDLGATSAMNLFFMLGMYPLKPGEAEFVLTGSLFDKVKLQLDNGSVIHILSQGNPFDSPVKDIQVNGQKHEGWTHDISEIIDNKSNLTINYKY
jgi:predicted alpha-1,2-mannosidase